MKTITIDTTSPAYSVDGKTIVELTVSALNFIQFTKVIAASRMPDEAAQARRLFRERVKVQTRGKLSNGSAIAITDPLISKLPIPHAFQLKTAIDAVLVTDETEGKPELLEKGDGIATAIRVRLGTP